MNDIDLYSLKVRLIANSRESTTGTGCWNYQCINVQGYGQMLATIDGRKKNYLAHRVSALVHGLLSDINNTKLLVCHKCDNPKCINPEHLFTGTYSDNSKDAQNKGRLSPAYTIRTHCPHGHEYTKENTFIGNKREKRCLTCHRERSREGMRRMKERRRNESKIS